MRTVDLVGGGADGTATRVAMAPGTGYFVQTVGQEPTSPAAGSLFWVADTGVRYGIEGGRRTSDRDSRQTVACAGILVDRDPGSMVGADAVRGRARAVEG